MGLVFLVASSLLGFAGVADDAGQLGERPIVGLDTDLAEHRVGADVHASASRAGLDTSTATVTLDAGLAGVRASPGGVEAAGHGLHVELAAPDLGSLFLADLWRATTPAPTGVPTTGPSAALDPQAARASSIPTGEDGDDGSALLTTLVEAAPALALAGLAVAQGQTSAGRGLGLRRYWPLVGLYARIPREEVLDHETRAAVYDLLRAKPGLSLEEIASGLELSRSTARHHLKKLEDAGFVRHIARGRCRIHYPTGRQEEAVVNHVLDHPQRARIAQLVDQEPLTLVQLSEVLDANVGAVHFHLRKLIEAGLVERIENGAVRYHRVAPE